MANETVLPTLFDRLMGAAGHDRGGLSRQAYQQLLLRDLQWLLGSVVAGELADLARYPHVARSVLNYGIPCSTGMRLTEQDVTRLTQDIERAIRTFEPRVLPDSLSVSLLDDHEHASRSQLVFRIRLAFWCEPYPLLLSVRAQWDVENGLVALTGE